jgi:DnaJ-class molecular chaperone
MTFRSVICDQCLGTGEVPAQADQYGGVWASGGHVQCPTCRGNGRTIFKVPEETAARFKRYEERIKKEQERK